MCKKAHVNCRLDLDLCLLSALQLCNHVTYDILHCKGNLYFLLFSTADKNSFNILRKSSNGSAMPEILIRDFYPYLPMAICYFSTCFPPSHKCQKYLGEPFPWYAITNPYFSMHSAGNTRMDNKICVSFKTSPWQVTFYYRSCYRLPSCKLTYQFSLTLYSRDGESQLF